MSIKPYYVTEFNRSLRPLTEYPNYKASENRRLSLYDAFFLLILLQDERISKVHNLYAYAIRILEDEDLIDKFRSDADEDLVDKYRSDAERLLRIFVIESSKLFGELFNVFNVHCLVHLSDETARHGCLMKFSAWKYESYLGQIKRSLRAPGRTLQQIVCRLMEKRSLLCSKQEASAKEDAVCVSQPHVCGPTIGTCDEQYHFMSVRDLGTFRVRSPNDACFVSTRGEVCVLRNIVRNNGEIKLVYRAFEEILPFFEYPFSSLFLGICKVKKLGPLKMLALTDMKKKAVLLPANECDVLPNPNFTWMNNVQCVCLPMLHHDKLSEMID